MSGMVYGPREQFDAYRNYFDSIDTHLGILTSIHIVKSCVNDAIQARIQQLEAKAEKEKLKSGKK